MARSEVAIVRTSPKTVLADHHRLMNLARYQDILPKDVDTALPDGSNYGFEANTQHIVANRKFAEANPAAAKLFAIMELSNNDISAQNLRMRDGEDSTRDIEKHADAWIAANRAKFDGWLDQARAAAE